MKGKKIATCHGMTNIYTDKHSRKKDDTLLSPFSLCCVPLLVVVISFTVHFCNILAENQLANQTASAVNLQPL